MPTTRLPNGITNLDQSHVHSDLMMPYEPQVHSHMEEFDVFHSANAPSTAEDWSIWAVGGFVLQQPSANGEIFFSPDLASNAVAQCQYSFEDVSPLALGLHYSVGVNIPGLVSNQIIAFGLADNVGTSDFKTNSQGYFFVLRNATLAFHIAGPSSTTIYDDLVDIEPGRTSLQIHKNDARNELHLGLNGALLRVIGLDEGQSLPANLLGFSGSIETTNGLGVSMEIDFMWVSNQRGYAS